MDKRFKSWINLSLLNLTIVACIGVLMRYKIGFDFPYLEQKNILHAHAYFAFTGWVTHLLYTFIYYHYKQEFTQKGLRYAVMLIRTNLVASYGILITYFVFGYSYQASFFVAVTILVSYFFVALFLSQLRYFDHNPGTKWLAAGLIFYACASGGAIYNAYMLSAGTFSQKIFLACQYIYLHFQFNGWFLLSCIGLFIGLLSRKGIAFDDNNIFRMIAYMCAPTLFLSTLWMKMPSWLYWGTVAATILQCVGWAMVVKFAWDNRLLIKEKFTRNTYSLFLLAAMALSIKMILQLGSTHPQISKLAYGFRPIVIAYIHLVVLGVITIFLFGYAYAMKIIPSSRLSHAGILLFVGGIFLNEFVLMIQGVASFSYFAVPHINQVLVFVSLIMLAGIVMVLIARKEIDQQ